MNREDIRNTTFHSLGVIEELCEACEKVGWFSPTTIQQEAIPVALEGKDVIALAETGSGKTGAFALPILQALLENPKKYFALILTPTRELAIQIKDQFEALGKDIGLKCCAIVGGMDFSHQVRELAFRPHIIIGTPGRLVNHLDEKKITLKQIRYLVMDEADRMLNLGFEEEVDKILKELSRDRRTMLFSATMTTKVKKLQRAHLKNPVRVEVSSRYQTVKKLQQKMLFIPVDAKSIYLTHILKEIGSESVIVFCETCRSTLKVALMLRALGFSAIPIYSKMNQEKRNKAIEKFKNKERSILVGTDVISRGLDIPNVDYVINFNLPSESKNYIHRVGRTARAGKAGTAITFVTQYEVETLQRLEHMLGSKLEVYPLEDRDVMVLKERVSAAEKESREEVKRILDETDKMGRKKKKLEDDDGDDDDTAESLGIRRNLKKKIKSKNFH